MSIDKMSYTADNVDSISEALKKKSVDKTAEEAAQSFKQPNGLFNGLVETIEKAGLEGLTTDDYKKSLVFSSINMSAKELSADQIGELRSKIIQRLEELDSKNIDGNKEKAESCLTAALNEACSDYSEKVNQGILNEANGITHFSMLNSSHFHCEGYSCSDFGVYAIKTKGKASETRLVCNHPICPVEMIRDFDTEEEQVVLAYAEPNALQTAKYLTVDKADISDRHRIVNVLGATGILVSSTTAPDMVNYFQDMFYQNYDQLTTTGDGSAHYSIKRCGWIRNGLNRLFVPYADNLKYSGHDGSTKVYKAIRTSGSFDEWNKVAKEIMNGNNIPLKTILTASFSSVLTSDAGTLPFFVHVWGSTGSGKTVALKIAASVWAEPKAYIQNFSGTKAGLENTAGFLHDLPLCIDELQSAREDVKKGESNLVYLLCEGHGSVRATRSGGATQQVKDWSLIMLSNGEQPLTNNKSDGGAVNRCIQIHPDGDLIEQAKAAEMADIVNDNYGHAGRKWIDRLTDGDILTIKALKNQYAKELIDDGVTGKQAAAAALLLAVSNQATTVFRWYRPLTVEDIRPYLVSAREVEKNNSIYEELCELPASEHARFTKNPGDETNLTWWGKVENGCLYFMKTQFQNYMQRSGYNAESFLKWAGMKKLILAEHGYYKLVRVKDKRYYFLALKLPEETEQAQEPEAQF